MSIVSKKLFLKVIKIRFFFYVKSGLNMCIFLLIYKTNLDRYINRSLCTTNNKEKYLKVVSSYLMNKHKN